jgi:proline iminopeptidase
MTERKAARTSTPQRVACRSRSRVRIAVLGLLAGVYRGVIWRWFRRWGATDAEVLAPFPGADLIPGGKRGATMAVTIDAPPSQVWSWLVQMGCDRAGWYSWDRLDNGGHPSADQIYPEWQPVAIGDRWASAPSGRSWFEVAALDPERFLALRASLHLDGRPFQPAGPRPRFYSDSSWGFALTELPGGRTRLVVSGYASSHPRALTAIGDLVFWEPAHWIMQTRQLINLKRRAERQAPPAGDLHDVAGEASPAAVA